MKKILQFSFSANQWRAGLLWTGLLLTACQLPPVQPLAQRDALPTLSPTAVASTPSSPTSAAVPTASTENIFTLILGPTLVPKGWAVFPCEGVGPLLCVLAGEETIGISELSLYPIETLPDVQAILTEVGLPPGPLTPQDPAQRAKLLMALQKFVENYHTGMEIDRQAEYGDQVRYVRLETEERAFGQLPGLRFGFAGLAPDDQVYERWITHVAFDGDLLYILVAFYRPDTVHTFRSDEELQLFLPYLEQIVAELRLPQE